MIGFEHELPEPGATAALAIAVAGVLRPGDVLALEGPLGAGKTTFTRALAEALGAEPGVVSSPTFVFVNKYPLKDSGVALSGGWLTHVDAYRLTSTDDLEALGWDQLFDVTTGRAAGQSAAVIEWPERIAEVLPGPNVLARIRLTPTGEQSRRAAFLVPAAWWERPGADLLGSRSPIRCRGTGEWVSPTAPTYPFANERARMADLHGWFSEKYGTTRDPQADDDADL